MPPQHLCESVRRSAGNGQKTSRRKLCHFHGHKTFETNYPAFHLINGSEFGPRRGALLPVLFFLGGPPCFFILASAAANLSARCFVLWSSDKFGSWTGAGMSSSARSGMFPPACGTKEVVSAADPRRCPLGFQGLPIMRHGIMVYVRRLFTKRKECTRIEHTCPWKLFGAGRLST